MAPCIWPVVHAELSFLNEWFHLLKKYLSTLCVLQNAMNLHNLLFLCTSIIPLWMRCMLTYDLFQDDQKDATVENEQNPESSGRSFSPSYERDYVNCMLQLNYCFVDLFQFYKTTDRNSA